jgi:hypothetical protein
VLTAERTTEPAGDASQPKGIALSAAIREPRLVRYRSRPVLQPSTPPFKPLGTVVVASIRGQTQRAFRSQGQAQHGRVLAAASTSL